MCDKILINPLRTNTKYNMIFINFIYFFFGFFYILYFFLHFLNFFTVWSYSYLLQESHIWLNLLEYLVIISSIFLNMTREYFYFIKPLMLKLILIERFYHQFEVTRYFTPQCYKSKIGCQNFVVEPMVTLGSMAGNRGTKMFSPNCGDPDDLCACTTQLLLHPISLQRIPTMWWTIVWMLLVEERLAMQRTMCCCPDSKRFPKRWMWCQ